MTPHPCLVAARCSRSPGGRARYNKTFVSFSFSAERDPHPDTVLEGRDAEAQTSSVYQGGS